MRFKKADIFEGNRTFFLYLQTLINGRLAEWLGNGLQNRVRRFKSATDLI